MPAYTTVSVRPSEERPAVRAKGTVRPSAKPSVKSARKRGRDGRAIFGGQYVRGGFEFGECLSAEEGGGRKGRGEVGGVVVVDVVRESMSVSLFAMGWYERSVKVVVGEARCWEGGEKPNDSRKESHRFGGMATGVNVG